MSRLDFNKLEVESFETSASFAAAPANTYEFGCCCTGCDSGCGIIPTGGGCESAETDTQAPVC